VVPKLGVNYPLGVICESSGGNAEPKILLFYIVSDNCEILRVIRCNHYLDLGNGSNKFGNQYLKCLIFNRIAKSHLFISKEQPLAHQKTIKMLQKCR